MSLEHRLSEVECGAYGARNDVGDTVRSRETVGRALALLRASRSTYSAPDLLETLAGCGVAEGDYVQASELVGVAQALRERTHIPVWGPASRRHEELLANLRAAPEVSINSYPALGFRPLQACACPLH